MKITIECENIKNNSRLIRIIKKKNLWKGYHYVLKKMDNILNIWYKN